MNVPGGLFFVGLWNPLPNLRRSVRFFLTAAVSISPAQCPGRDRRQRTPAAPCPVPGISSERSDGNGVVSSVDDIVQRGLRDAAAGTQCVQRQLVFVAQIQNPYLQCFLGTHFPHLTVVMIPPAALKVTSFPLTFRFWQKIGKEVPHRSRCRKVKEGNAPQ